MANKKVVVAFSGGLDTSYTVMKLTQDGWDVYAACANTGGFSAEQLKTNEENAFKLGAKAYVTLDVTQEYYEKSLKYMIFGNVLRNNCYPISVSSERIFQAIAIARYAKEIGADAIAHGSTGAGNDQIRFDMTFLVMAPGVEIITLTRDKKLTRKEEVDYLNEHGFFADFTKLKYSYNVGIWGTSICGGELLDPTQGLPEDAYLKHVTAKEDSLLKIEFNKGEIVAVNGEQFDDKVKAIQKIEEIGASYAIGRDANVGDTIIGIKGRVGFEAAAPKLIIEAHRLLEKSTLSKWQQYWKDQVANWYGMFLHESQYLEPVMPDIEAMLTSSQRNVTGTRPTRRKDSSRSALPHSAFITVSIRTRNADSRTRFSRMKRMIKVGILGAAGYTGGELIRLLLNHPEAEIVFANSESNAGNPVSDVHEGLIGDTDLTFTSEMPFDQVDVVFFCFGHGKSQQFLREHTIPGNVKVIDLAQDFRIKGNHDFVYGLPEINKEEIMRAQHVANPGCFATAIQLALLPAAKMGLLTSDVAVNAITGSTGAGQKPGATTHFSWRNNNLSIYKPFTHQHIAEIRQSLTQVQGYLDAEIDFIPYRGDFARGIFCTAVIKTPAPVEDVIEAYKDFYKDAAFTHYSDQALDLKQVVNTNKALVHVEKYGNKLLVTSCIDNLLKGAVGQAVQNMNLMFSDKQSGKTEHNIDETDGLKLKASAF